MAKCEKCVHYNFCLNIEACHLRMILAGDKADERCKLFKSTADFAPIADTVRKMQERFIAEIEQTPNANEHFIKAWKAKIDQIAKEMSEEVIGNGYKED